MKTDFTQIKFNPRYHSYTYEGKRLTPCTRLAASFGEPFDREGISQRKAKELGVSQEEVLAQWDAKRDLGTQVHAIIAQILRGEKPHEDPVLSLGLPPHVGAFLDFWQSFGPHVEVMEVEYLIGDHELGIAGTVDAVLVHKPDGLAHLFDWKTNSTISATGYGNRMLKAPFQQYDDSDLNQYSLQLSLYKLILRRQTNLALGNCYLIHLTETGQAQPYKAEDFSVTLEAWLKERAK